MYQYRLENARKGTTGKDTPPKCDAGFRRYRVGMRQNMPYTVTGFWVEGYRFFEPDAPTQSGRFLLKTVGGFL